MYMLLLGLLTNDLHILSEPKRGIQVELHLIRFYYDNFKHFQYNIEFQMCNFRFVGHLSCDLSGESIINMSVSVHSVANISPRHVR